MAMLDETNAQDFRRTLDWVSLVDGVSSAIKICDRKCAAGLTYPVTFEKASMESLEQRLPFLPAGDNAFRKVKTLCEANFGKVKLVEGRDLEGVDLPDLRGHCFVVKEMRKTAGRGIECPRNELNASLELAALGLPHVVEVLGAWQDEHSFFLATEYCSGGELFAALQKAPGGRFDSEDGLREVLSQMLVAVQALHERGIAHRDISLENFLVTEDGSLRIIDFAQAIRVCAPGEDFEEKEARVPRSVSQSGFLADMPGKLNYQAPDIHAGTPYLATKIDIFALGVMLYTLAVGWYPFDSSSSCFLFPKQEATASRCLRLGQQLEALRLRDRVSASLQDLLEQMLAPDAASRPTAAEALAHPWLAGTLDGFNVAEQDDAKTNAADKWN